MLKSFLELGEITTPHGVFLRLADALARGETGASWLRRKEERAQGGKSEGVKKKKKKKDDFSDIRFASMEPVRHCRVPSKTANGRRGVKTPTDF